MTNVRSEQKEIANIEGTLLMLDDRTPHLAVPVQAIREGKVIATTLSDNSGRYRLANLEAGSYQLRCQVLGGYVYYRATDHALRFTFHDSGTTESAMEGELGDILHIQNGKTLTNADFRFAEFKKGTWRSYTSLDGLAFDEVTSIHGTPDGVIWFATQGGGVSRYDGKEFVNLTTKDGLAHNHVNAVYCDPDGIVWLGTASGGVSRYDGKNFVNFTTEDGLVHNNVYVIYRSPDGLMWFGTDGGGISCYDGEDFVNFTTQNSELAHDCIKSICCSPGGVMWFGTYSGGVSRYDGKKFVNFTKRDGLLSDEVESICVDADGAIWFGTRGGGVSRYDGEGFVSFTTEDGLVNNIVYDIHVDADGVMWFATYGGISRYDGNTFVNFTIEDGLVSNGVYGGIYRDPDGMMWFGTYGGVSRYDGDSFTNFTRKDGLSRNGVRSIQWDPDGALWLGTWRGGLFRYDGKEFISITTKDELARDMVNVIHLEPDGVVWIGTQWDGLFRYNGRKLERFLPEDGLPHPNIWAIHRDLDGMMWFGTGWYDGAGGLARYDGKQFERPFDAIDGLAGRCVNAIHRDPDGDLWLGTSNGVWRYDGQNFAHFTTEDGLAYDAVIVIHRDPDGAMWFGTDGGGISCYDGRGMGDCPTNSSRGMGDCPHFVNFTTRDGLANGFALAIYRDPDGILWVGTSGGGVCMYDGTAWSSLDTRDGLAGNQVWEIEPDPDGSLWFGTSEGLTRYRRNTTPPRVSIVSVTSDQTYRLKTQDARLKTEGSGIPALIVGQRVTIEYRSRDSKTVPEKRQYRCCVYETSDVRRETSDSRPGTSEPEFESQVSGLKSGVPYLPPTKETSFDWIPEEPGTYIFQVQAIDRDLNYSEPAVLSLTVQPDPKLVSLQTEVKQLRQEVGWKYSFENIIGDSEGISLVHSLMERAIDSGLTVLITGETGTGKELVAKAIHHNSRRKDRPLRSLNCGAVPKDLVASTLFGHRKGAFTGADADRMGLFEEASGGTVLLDEIGEMPQDAQIHLLRVLEEREVQRLGENAPRGVDVWVIAMSNRDLEGEVEAGRFREDLFYRLSEFPIDIPPLRERPEDIPLLAQHFLRAYSEDIEKELAGFAPDVLEMLQSYPWPGNVRELRNMIRRAAALAEQGEQIQTYHFPPEITQGESLIQEIMSERLGLSSAVERLQRRLVENALQESEGNRTHAAQMLSIDRSNLIRLMKRLGIE
jgi:DNA-binding NtrC family response regulator/ligand-binding sensor domain-containing protein